MDKNFSELSSELKYTDQKNNVEVAVIKICQPQMDDSKDALLERIKLLEDKLDKGVTITTTT